MSMQSHIAELSRRHQALEREIQSVKSTHSVDELQLSQLKRRKLVLKDEITRLRH